MFTIRHAILTLCISLILAGCTNTPNSQLNVEWQSHQQRLSQIDHYLVTGKLGYISPQQRESLNFQWRHSQKESQLRLTTFLGQTVLNLTMTPQGAHVETYDDRTLSGTNADELVYQLTGLTIPIHALQDWFLGNPTQADHYQFNPTHTIASLNKVISGQTWQLDYLSYHDEELNQERIPLPNKMTLQHSDTKLNIVISKWVLNP